MRRYGIGDYQSHSGKCNWDTRSARSYIWTRCSRLLDPSKEEKSRDTGLVYNVRDISRLLDVYVQSFYFVIAFETHSVGAMETMSASDPLISTDISTNL